MACNAIGATPSRASAETSLQGISGGTGIIITRGSFMLGADGPAVEPYLTVTVFSSLHPAAAIGVGVMQQAVHLLNQVFEADAAGVVLLPPCHLVDFHQLVRCSPQSGWQPRHSLDQLPRRLTHLGTVNKVGLTATLLSNHA